MISRTSRSFLAGLLLAGCAQGGSGAPLPSVAGSWSVTSTYRDTTCPTPGAGIGAFDWLISSDGQQGYSVVVSGDTPFTNLVGAAEGDTLKVTGVLDRGAHDQSQWRLRLEGEDLVGERILTTTTAGEGKSRFGDDPLCTVFYDVRAKHK